MEEERKLEKISNNQYLLTINRQEGKIITRVQYDKKEMKENVRQLNDQFQMLMAKKKQLENQLKKLDTKDTPRLRELLKQMQDANLLGEKSKTEDQLKMVRKDLDINNAQLKEIRNVIPELFRNGKKT